jgi:hypothetical protein
MRCVGLYLTVDDLQRERDSISNLGRDIYIDIGLRKGELHKILSNEVTNFDVEMEPGC